MGTNPEINELIAAELSNAVYPGNSPPTGWISLGPQYSGFNNGNSFTTYINTTESAAQAVIVFKGTDFDDLTGGLSQLASDLLNNGGFAWESIASQVTTVINLLDLNYHNYNIMTDGHSLGGGMAQTAALEYELSGYGQNSLPISNTAITTDKQITDIGGYNKALSEWRDKNNTFDEVNTQGDIATEYYEGLSYISTSLTTLTSPYASLEVYGVLTGLLPLAAIAAYLNHSIGNVISLEQSELGESNVVKLDSIISSDSAAIDSAISSDPLTFSSSGMVTASTSNGLTYSASLVSDGLNADTYAVSVNGVANQIDIVTTNGNTLGINTEVDNGASVEIPSASAESGVIEDFTFLGSVGSLQIDDPESFEGTVFGFFSGNTIDLAGFGTASSATIGAGNTIAIQGGDLGPVTLNLDPSHDYSGDNFFVSADGNGGTDVVVNVPPALTVPGAQVVTTGVPASVPGISVADPDAISGNKTFTVMLLDNTGGGLFEALAEDGGTVSGSGTTALKLTGGLATVNAELTTVSYIGSAVTPDDDIDLEVLDGRGGSAYGTIPITVNNQDTAKPNQTLNIGAGGGGLVIGSASSVSNTNNLPITNSYLTSIEFSGPPASVYTVGGLSSAIYLSTPILQGLPSSISGFYNLIIKFMSQFPTISPDYVVGEVENVDLGFQPALVNTTNFNGTLSNPVSNVWVLTYEAYVSHSSAPSVTAATYVENPTTFDGLSSGFAVADTAADVSADIAALSAAVASGNLTQITLTDIGTPVLSLTQSEATAYANVLAKIAVPYDIDILNSAASQPYSSYVDEYNNYNQLLGVSYDFTNFADQPYSSFVYNYSSGNVYVGSQFFYTNVIGQPYTGYEYDYDGGGNVTRTVFTGVSYQPYSSYEYDFNGGVYAGAKFEFTTVPTGATYTSYETDYDAFDNFTGDKFFFTDITAQAYTSEEEDFNSVGALTRVLLSGVTGQSYSSLEEDYNAGTYAGYKAYYAITGQAYSGEEVDVSASNVLTKVVYTGLTGTPYSSVEEDFANGALQDTVYDFTNPTGQNFYAYQATDDANGNALQESVDNNDGSHTIVGFQANQTFTSIGNDTITGGGANETFVFNPAFGHDTVTDFGSYLSGAGHDTISLASSEFANFAAVLASAQNVNGNAVITAANGDSLTLANVTTSALAANSGDFTFHT